MSKDFTIVVKTGKIQHSIPLPGVSQKDYEKISRSLLEQMGGATKTREAIAAAFELAVERCPDANHSDIWHHVIYRQYLTHSSPQSWVRTSGEAFELFLSAITRPCFLRMESN